VSARFEVPTGAVDGANDLYQTADPYLPGTVVIHLNGQARPGCVLELGAASFRTLFVPDAGDGLVVYYLQN
jgi:hypothetical protein